ncbi:MAG: hypothetical protein NTW62_01515 [Candidatus Nomurabacteria bacterium]|nr:hypothetical protein [Candidatus Nomurabacteria bacterium]
MKKYLAVLFLMVFIVPSIAFASWWNPLSWFNSWNFHKKTDVINVTSSSIDAEIKSKVDEQVKNTLKLQEDDNLKITQQKIDEQKRIDKAVKDALDKQKVQSQPTQQVVIQTPQPPVITQAEKNYYNDFKYLVKAHIDIEEAFKTWLQDTSNQFRSASLTLAGYTAGGLYGQSRDIAIELASKNVTAISSIISDTTKWISSYQSLQEALDKDPNQFVGAETFSKLEKIEITEESIAKTKETINSSLDSVMNALKYHL